MTHHSASLLLRLLRLFAANPSDALTATPASRSPVPLALHVASAWRRAGRLIPGPRLHRVKSEQGRLLWRILNGREKAQKAQNQPERTQPPTLQPQSNPICPSPSVSALGSSSVKSVKSAVKENASGCLSGFGCGSAALGPLWLKKVSRRDSRR